jgi:DNA-directed RNA polymerase beta subunit
MSQSSECDSSEEDQFSSDSDDEDIFNDEKEEEETKPLRLVYERVQELKQNREEHKKQLPALKIMEDFVDKIALLPYQDRDYSGRLHVESFNSMVENLDSLFESQKFQLKAGVAKYQQGRRIVRNEMPDTTHVEVSFCNPKLHVPQKENNGHVLFPYQCIGRTTYSSDLEVVLRVKVNEEVVSEKPVRLFKLPIPIKSSICSLKNYGKTKDDTLPGIYVIKGTQYFCSIQSRQISNIMVITEEKILKKSDAENRKMFTSSIKSMESHSSFQFTYMFRNRENDNNIYRVRFFTNMCRAASLKRKNTAINLFTVLRSLMSSIAQQLLKERNESETITINQLFSESNIPFIHEMAKHMDHDTSLSPSDMMVPLEYAVSVFCKSILPKVVHDEVMLETMIEDLGDTITEVIRESRKVSNPSVTEYTEYFKVVEKVKPGETFKFYTTRYPDNISDFIQYSIEHVLLCHIKMDPNLMSENPLFTYVGTNFRKMLELGKMLMGTFMAEKRLVSATDRDNLTFTQFVADGSLVWKLISKVLNYNVREVYKKVALMPTNSSGSDDDDELKWKVASTIHQYFENEFTRSTERLETFFICGKWGQKNVEASKGVTQLIKWESRMYVVSQLQKFSVPSSSKKSKVTKPREVHMTHTFIKCLLKTPEREGTGLVTFAAMGMRISVIMDDGSVSKIRRILSEGIRYNSNSFLDLECYLNGEFMGWWAMDSSSSIEELKMKIKCVYPLSSVSCRKELKKMVLWVSTMEGRGLAPLLTLDAQGRLLGERSMKTSVGTIVPLREMTPLLSWEEYLRLGVIEFADTSEMIEAVIAPSLEECKFRFKSQGQPYKRYCTLRMGNAFSEISNIVPYMSNIPAPRGAFRAQHLGQAISVPRLSFMKYGREKMLRFLVYPESPLVKTRAADLLGVTSDYSYGVNAIVAVIQSTGKDIEDSIVIKKQFKQRGAFTSVFKTTEFLKGREASQFRIPTKEKLNPSHAYRHMSSETHPDFHQFDGMIKPKPTENGDLESFPSHKRNINSQKQSSPGYVKTTSRCHTKVHKGDVLLTQISENNLVKEVTYQGREGFIQKVESYMSQRGEVIRCVHISEAHFAEVGDKFCSNDSQKGIAEEMDDVDMPFVMRTGQIPDILFNPYSLNTRNTLSLFHEMLTSTLLCSVDGRRCVGVFQGDFYIRKEEWVRIILATLFKELSDVDKVMAVKNYFTLTKVEGFLLPDIRVKFSQLPKYPTSIDLKNIMNQPTQECYLHVMSSTIIPIRDIEDETLKAEFRKVEQKVNRLKHSEPGVEVDINSVMELCRMYLCPAAGEVMASGTSGELIECQVFQGFRYYFAVKHLAEDKLNYRNTTGIKDVLLKAPTKKTSGTKGKSKLSLKTGIQELQSYISMGAPFIIRERMLNESDQHTAYICTDCKTFAIHRADGTVYCRICGRSHLDGMIVEVKIPFALVVLYFYELSVGRQIQIETKIIEGSKSIPKSLKKMKKIKVHMGETEFNSDDDDEGYAVFANNDEFESLFVVEDDLDLFENDEEEDL